MKKTAFLRLQWLANSIGSTNSRRRSKSTVAKRRAFQVELLESRQVMAGDITGTVYDDLNANGQDDAGDNGLPGWTVFVDTNNNATKDSGEPFAVTDDRGRYAIVGLPPVSTTIYEIPQVGYRPTPGFSDHQTVVVKDGREVRVKFPNVAAPVITGQVAGTVFEDFNENGIREATEDGLEGWTLFVDSDNNGSFDIGEPTTHTNVDGDYIFAGIPVGAATVYEVPQDGLLPTAGGLFPTLGASDHRAVTVVAGATVRSDFANRIPQIGNILGHIWNDTNGDGILAATEPGLAGRTVYVDLNSSGTQDADEPSRITDAEGAYSFDGIRRGIYRVTEVIPATWIAAEGRPASVNANVSIGGSSTVDFFNLVPTTGSVSGLLWNDLDGNGVQGASEALLSGWQVYVDANGNGLLDASDPQGTSNALGMYAIAGVAYGTSTVREVVPSNWVGTNPASGLVSFKLLNDESRTGLNFGNREKIGSIRGTLWNDADGDRLRDATEGPLASWSVYLDLNSDGQLGASEPTATSDSAGAYLFTRVPVGTYQVTEVVQAGWTAAIGASSAVSTSVSIGGVQVVDFYDLVPSPGSVSGVIWNDVDSNGLQGATEPVFEDWQVYADLNGNAILDAGEPSATTDAAGVYTVTGVPYGANTVREIIQPGFRSTNYPNGAATLFLLNGENRAGVSFGNHEPADFVISGTAFFDADHSGFRDASERGLSGITVYLDINGNGVLDPAEPQTLTSVDLFFTPAVNETGAFSFTHLARGTYTIREIVPAELEATPSAVRSQVLAIGPASQTDVNFANSFRANEIHGVVFDDTDEDRLRDAGEYTRPGIGLYIDLDRDDVFDLDEPSTETGEDGGYSFVGLTLGAYVVRERTGIPGPRTYPTTGGGTLLPAGISNPAQGIVTPGSIVTTLAQGQVHTQTVSLTLPGGGTGITNLVDVFLLFDDTGSFTSNSPLVRAAFPTIISNLQASLPGVDLGFGVGRLEEYANFASESATGRPFILNQPIVASTTLGFSASIQTALDRMAPGYGGDQPETDIEALYQVVTGLGFDGNNNGSVLDSGPAGLAATQLTPGSSGDVPSYASFQADPANNVLRGDGHVGGAGFRPGALPIILTATDTGFAYQPKGESSITGTGGISLPLSALTQTSRGTTPFSSGAGLQETVTGLNALGALVIGLGTNPIATQDPRQGLEALAQLTGAVNRTTTTIANGTADPIAPGDPFYFQIGTGFGATVANGITNAIQNAVTNVAIDITLRASDPRVRIINHTGTLLGIGAGQTASFDIEFVGDGKPHRFDFQFVREGTNVVVGSIPVVIGTPIVGEGYSYDELEDGEIHNSSHFGNYVANVAPSFVGGVDQIAVEDAGTQTVVHWAANIHAGTAIEAGQALNFTATNDNAALFSTQPSIAPDGTLTFTPAPNAHGSAIVSVQLHDDGGVGSSGADTSPVQTFRIAITPVADAPLAGSDAYVVQQGESLTVAASGVMVNDVDADGDTLTVQVSATPAHGTVNLSSDGSFVYTPDTGFFGSDRFDYVANDGISDSNVATVTLAITRSNSAPFAANDVFSTKQNTALQVTAPGLLLNDADAEGDALTAVIALGPSHGTLTLNADGSFIYLPAFNYSGPDSFTYQASDGTLASAMATVDINVVSTNVAPIALDDSYSTSEDTALNVPVAGVISNDSDADADALSATLVSLPTHGALTLTANGAFTYTPAANYNGQDSFSYRVNDGSVDSNVAVVNINVTSVNDAPVAGNNSYTTNEDTLLAVASPGVLANDTDVEGSLLTPTLISIPTLGTLSFNSNGAFTYQPNANANGLDSFTYTVNDGSADSAIATVTINVVAVNDAPTAAGESFSSNEDSVLNVAAPGVLSNDADIEGTLLRPVMVTGPAHGALTLNLNGSFVYTPTANYNGPDSFTYRASEGLLSSNIATVAILVVPINDAPLAGNDAYSTNQNTVLAVAPRGVLLNDTDAEGDTLSAAVATGPSHGTLLLNADGSFSYTPALNFSGTDTFTYRASDASIESGLATVTLTVSAPPPPGPKFFVVDATSKATFKYAADGASIASHLLNKSDSKPRGIASNPAGTIQWVIDAAGDVFIYTNTGTLLGQWTPQNIGKPEGITVWNNDLWLVDPTQDRVFRFAGGANLRAGRVAATSSFASNGANLNSTDLVSDGAHIWVVDNTVGTDRVFRYLVSGVLEGSWTISATNPSPTGITLDPMNVDHLWIVDSSTDRVLQYSGATARLSGIQEPALTFALQSANGDAQGIADPMPHASAEQTSETTGAHDAAAAIAWDTASPATDLQYRQGVDEAMADWIREVPMQVVAHRAVPRGQSLVAHNAFPFAPSKPAFESKGTARQRTEIPAHTALGRRTTSLSWKVIDSMFAEIAE